MIECDVKDMTVELDVSTATLHITVPKYQIRNLGELKDPICMKLGKKPKKRSRDANAYMWVLADKIAEKVGIGKDEVYRQAIVKVGKFDSYQMRKEAVDRFVEIWERGGLGNVAVIAGTDMRFAYVNAYYGSSTYTTEQMGRLIDELIEEAQELDIDTITPKEKAMMMEDWERGRRI